MTARSGDCLNNCALPDDGPVRAETCSSSVYKYITVCVCVCVCTYLVMFIFVAMYRNIYGVKSVKLVCFSWQVLVLL